MSIIVEKKGLLSENKCKGMNRNETFSDHIIKDTASLPAQETFRFPGTPFVIKVVNLVRGLALGRFHWLDLSDPRLRERSELVLENTTIQASDLVQVFFHAKLAKTFAHDFLLFFLQ